MKKVPVNISEKVIAWLEQQILYDADTLQMIAQWKKNNGNAPLKEIEIISNKTKIPFGYFFLSEPPKEQLSILECRTIQGERQTPSRNFIDTFYNMKRIQEWMSHYAEEFRGRLDFVGCMCEETCVTTIAASIRKELDIPINWYTNYKIKKNAFRFLRGVLEKNGILVCQNGVVGANTHRPLDVAEFRAFTIVDQYAPLIFINSVDATSAKTFSLLHEVAHIWMGTDNLDNDDFVRATYATPTEKICNAVASEILVPNVEFKRQWMENNFSDPINVINELMQCFPCSSVVLARKALDNEYISKKQYVRIVEDNQKNYTENKRKKKSGGGEYYNTAASRYGQPLLQALHHSIQENKTQYTEAYRLTGAYGKTFDTLLTKTGVK